jgi:hypothetical protein
MNLLTQKRPQSELVQILKSTPPLEFRYLDKPTLDRHMHDIFEYKFKKTATPQDRASCKEIARGFTYVIPHVDRYELLMKRVRIEEEDLAHAYRSSWHLLPKKHKNQRRKAALQYNESVASAISQLTEFVNRQAYHLNQMEDEMVEQVMDLESTEIEVKLSTEPGYYIEPAPKEDRYRMTPKQVSRYLIQQSKGMIYYDAIEISRKLREFGFEQSPHCTAFYVKIK